MGWLANRTRLPPGPRRDRRGSAIDQATNVPDRGINRLFARAAAPAAIRPPASGDLSRRPPLAIHLPRMLRHSGMTDILAREALDRLQVTGLRVERRMLVTHLARIAKLARNPVGTVLVILTANDDLVRIVRLPALLPLNDPRRRRPGDLRPGLRGKR